MVKRIFVEKKAQYAAEAENLLADINNSLRIEGIIKARIINRYDVENIDTEDFDKAVHIVFSEPPVDNVYFRLPEQRITERIFAVAPLPGQFDQRADSCEQCLELLTQKPRPKVKTAKIYILSGYISDEEFDAIKDYVINPVESSETDFRLPDTLSENITMPDEVEVLEGFNDLSENELRYLIEACSLSMDMDDLKFTQEYFKKENREPTITEIRVLDTYWSDHCRHTTFLTVLKDIEINVPEVKETFEEYLAIHNELRPDKPITLMDIATLAAKKIRADGKLDDLDESEEINACSIKIDVNINGKFEKWLLMFKNETHNHPTEIEPFGGAATCLGGAIRDPLSGRSYVYQAMRITGAANPLVSVKNTIKGKLPQRKICVTAANGYSSYGNQIGLATGFVQEVYHPGYAAKRMEIGAVIGAAAAKDVKRQKPEAGNIVILLGGKTGRDGCGGATGSSKAHTVESIAVCGAEVQKGNPPEERKMQRLLRNPQITAMIKRCNDFGAGGVSVAIGELADGLDIYLDKVPKKYEGLDGTELAISESQERMAVVIDKENLSEFTLIANSENLEATYVADITDTETLRMFWNDNIIVNLKRSFLNSNGATKYTSAVIDFAPIPENTDSSEIPIPPKPASIFGGDEFGDALSDILCDCDAEMEEIEDGDNANLSIYTGHETSPFNLPNDDTLIDSSAEQWFKTIKSLNVCSQRGLIERFDSTIGAGSVFVPFGGLYQSTPSQVMAAKIPVLKGETNTVSLMSYGFNPFISEADPYKGAILAVIESVSKIVAAGGDYRKTRLTFQEYFERLRGEPKRWGKPLAALLGAFKAQIELGTPAIGGKDSMSGSFEDYDVPPTLVSFAVATTDLRMVTNNVFHTIQSSVILVKPEYIGGVPTFDSLKKTYSYVSEMIETGRAKNIWAIGAGGIAEGIAKMSFGNKIGFRFTKKFDFFTAYYGGFIIELKDKPLENEELLGITTIESTISTPKYTINLPMLKEEWEKTLEPIFPSITENKNTRKPQRYIFTASKRIHSALKFAKPRVLIPVFPGTNCEYDTAAAFEKAGAIPEIIVIKNLTTQNINESIKTIEKSLYDSQILMLPGGFSGGDEPDGSAKFIAAFFRNPYLTEAVRDLINNRCGLVCGICNGFQALLKLGLLPFGDIVPLTADSPTLTFNVISRHQSKYVRTVVSSNKSPWLAACRHGDIHTIPVSHGEGRFVANDKLLDTLAKSGQIATQYIDLECNPTYDIRHNPNGSIDAIEGITSPDGRIFGKMGHSERCGNGIGKNITGEKFQPIFLCGVRYFN